MNGVLERARTLPTHIRAPLIASARRAGRFLQRFVGADGAVSATRGSLLHPALVDAPLVQPVSVLTARFRGRRSCGIGFGGLGGQSHGRQDSPDGVLGLDQGNEAQWALAARTRDVNLERSPEQLAP